MVSSSAAAVGKLLVQADGICSSLVARWLEYAVAIMRICVEKHRALKPIKAQSFCFHSLCFDILDESQLEMFDKRSKPHQRTVVNIERILGA